MRRSPHGQTNRVAHSAGGVLYRSDGAVLWVVLIATGGGVRWGLPKGQICAQETPEMAAQREIEEETNLRGEVVRRLETIEYWFRSGPDRIHKYVDLYLLRYHAGEIVPQEAEVDDARWFPLEDAIRVATFPRERAVLEHVWELFQCGKLP